MENSQNGLNLKPSDDENASAGPGFFGGTPPKFAESLANPPEEQPGPTACQEPMAEAVAAAETMADPFTPATLDAAEQPSAQAPDIAPPSASLSLSFKGAEETAAPAAAPAPAAAAQPAMAIPPPPVPGTQAGTPPAAVQQPAPPPPAFNPPPPPVAAAAAPAAVAATEKGSGLKKLLIAFVALLLLAGIGAAAWPLAVQPMMEKMEERRIANLVWPYVQLDGVMAAGVDGLPKAILGGEIVPVGELSPDGIEVKEVEQGQVLLGYDGAEQWVLVGDRTY